MSDELAGVPDDVLAAAAKRARGLVSALEAGDFADLGVARYELDSAASDRVLARNFDRTQAARSALRRIEDEIARRAQTPEADNA